MVDTNPIGIPIEIINPGNGLPGIAPCLSVGPGSKHSCPDNIDTGGSGGPCWVAGGGLPDIPGRPTVRTY